VSARRSRLSSLAVILGAAAAMVVLAALIAIVSLAGHDRGAKHRIAGGTGAPAAMLGDPVTPSAEMRKQLGPVHGNAPVFRLGRVGARVFYRVESERDGTCYAVGSDARFGVILCPGQRGSGPVVDLSIVEVTPASDDVRVVRLQGVVSGRVASLRLVDSTGSSILDARVSDGAYYVEHVPAQPVAALIALDAAGHVVHRIPYAKTP
jgi:hypothetical protein